MQIVIVGLGIMLLGYLVILLDKVQVIIVTLAQNARATQACVDHLSALQQLKEEQKDAAKGYKTSPGRELLRARIQAHLADKLN